MMKLRLIILGMFALACFAQAQTYRWYDDFTKPYLSSSFGTLHGTATDTSLAIPANPASSNEIGFAFTEDSIVAQISVQAHIAGSWGDTTQIAFLTYTDSTTSFGEGICAKITAAGVKYAWTKGNADSLVYKTFDASTTNPGHVKRTTSGDVTTTDSTSAGAFLVYGDTTGSKLRAHSATNLAYRVQGIDISSLFYGYDMLRVYVQCLARTGKEGTYKVYWKQY
jgi:hypothetical protein